MILIFSSSPAGRCNLSQITQIKVLTQISQMTQIWIDNIGVIFTSHKYLLSYPVFYERRNKKEDNPSTALKWVAEFRFGKCRQAYFFLKGLQHYWQRKSLPTHYRTSIFVKWVAEFRFGKCRQAYFFKVSDIIGKSEFANPLKVSDIIGKERVCQPIKGLWHYWQRKSLPTHFLPILIYYITI